MSTTLRTLASEKEQSNREIQSELFTHSPIHPNEQVAQVGLFQRRQELSKVLFFHEIYQKILPVHGVILEFGTRWGQNLTTLANLRGILEPYNYNRRIVGFDTFEGFEGIHEKDGTADFLKKGAFGVSDGYEQFLGKLIATHEAESPLNHIRKFEICKGDAPAQLDAYLERNPQTLIAFAWFDFDIYAPTVACLKRIKPYLVKGAVIGFDELNDPGFPGETIALREVFETAEIKLQRNQYAAMQSYFVVGE